MTTFEQIQRQIWDSLMDHERRVFLQLIQDELPSLTLRELGEILTSPAARSVGALPVSTLLSGVAPAASAPAAKSPRRPAARAASAEKPSAEKNGAAPGPRLRTVPQTPPQSPISARPVEAVAELDARRNPPVANTPPEPSSLNAPSGLAGHHGPSGLAGHHGPSGLAGHHGPSGLNGHHGPSGLNGHHGPEGLNGHHGPEGLAATRAEEPSAAPRRSAAPLQLEIAPSADRSNVDVIRSAVSRTLAQHNRFDPDTLVLNALRSTGDWIRARDLRPRVGLQPDDLRAVLNRLVKLGAIRREGEGPDTVYQVVPASAAAGN